jgi:hypothetical protein
LQSNFVAVGEGDPFKPALMQWFDILDGPTTKHSGVDKDEARVV